MRLQRRAFLVLLLIAACTVVILPLTTTQAQSATNVTVTLVMSSFNRDAIADQMLTDFKTAHPGVNVNVVLVENHQYLLC